MIQIEGFNVRIVQEGESYGRDFCLVHDEADALVEFYDSKQTHCGTDGQFVSRYYIYTLLGFEPGRIGLCLDGGIPEWSISPQGVREVQRYLRGFLAEQAILERA
jgi:hypothetical protein